jgi:hypothetical protein
MALYNVTFTFLNAMAELLAGKNYLPPGVHHARMGYLP